VAISLKESIAMLQVAMNDTLVEFEGKKIKPDLISISEYYKFIYECHGSLTSLVEILSNIKEELSKNVVPAVLEANNVTNITIGEKQLIVGGRMRANLKENGQAWLSTVGYGDIIKNTVNAHTLTAAVKAYIEEKGMLPPDDAVSVYIEKYVAVRKAK
jgi:hypothetical protein